MQHPISKHSRIVFVLSCLVSLAAAMGAGRESPAAPPNVILILTDDQGYGDIHSHGNDKIDTPVLDALAAAGARFDRFFVSPLCSPTRSALLTGRYYRRTGVRGVCQGTEVMRADEVTVAQVLKKAGYATGCFGKWHNGENYPYHPNGKGFDEFFGFCGGHWDNYFDPVLERNGTPARRKGYITDLLTDAAIEWIGQNRQRPFFCYIPYNAPHAPRQAPEKYVEKYTARGLGDGAAAFYAMVEKVDENIGRLLAKLDAWKLADNTAVFFITDNGSAGGIFNAGMRGGKGSSLEGGCRVPCFARWPARIRPGTVISPIAAHIDLLPTIAEMCGAVNPETKPLDGVSLVPLLTGNTTAWTPRRLFEVGAVRTQQWRLQTGKKGELYDMPNDPGQSRNVAADHPDVVAELTAAYDAWFADVQQGQEGPWPPPIPVGHLQSPVVYLNAHRARGGVGRTVRWTSAWFANWRKSDTQAVWPIDVVAAGRFEVALMATCPASAVGSRVRVTAARETVEGALHEAHDPDLRAGRENIARSRPEKDWTALKLGVLTLPKGPAELSFEALQVVGQQGFDLMSVRLERLP